MPNGAVVHRRTALLSGVLAVLLMACGGGDTMDSGIDASLTPDVMEAGDAADSSVVSGLLPWEMNQATPPAPDGGNQFPETLNFHTGSYQFPGTNTFVPSVHAKGYIDAPVSAVWHAARDPQVGRDPTSTNAFSILAWNVEPQFEFSFRTDHVVDTIITLEWQVDWDLGVVQGTTDNPTVGAERWAKSGGNSMLSTLEGSLEVVALDGEPNVTEVDYQYHLQAPLSGDNTIESYLTVIYGRLRDESHNVPLVPDDCDGCPPAPDGY